MKILVPVKQVVDPDNADQVIIGDDGRAVSPGALELVPNPFDEIALEVALRLLEPEPGSGLDAAHEVVLLGIGGDGLERTLRQALALGATRAIWVRCDEKSLDAVGVAHLIGAVAQKEAVDGVFLGKTSTDGGGAQVPQMVGACLGWPCATPVLRISRSSQELFPLTVLQLADDGDLTVQLGWPMVLGLDLPAAQPQGVVWLGEARDYGDGPRFAALRQVMAARKKPVEQVTPTDLGVSIRSRVEVVSVVKPATNRGARMVDSVGALVSAVDELGGFPGKGGGVS